MFRQFISAGQEFLIRVRNFSILFALILYANPVNSEVASWVLFDVDSGHVYDYHDPHRKWHPASLTKLMTAYLVFSAIREGEISIDSTVTVPQNVAEIPASKMGYAAGTKLTVDNALKMVIVKSANDIAVGLAELVSGSEEKFVAKMNMEANRLGMRQTNFTNPHGLPDENQISSARDMALLSRNIWLEFPQFREYFQISGIRVGGRVHWSANRHFLTRVEGAIGLKTGYICDSGFNLAATVQRENRTMIAIILGAGSNLERTGFASKIIDAGFNVSKFSTVLAKKITNFHSRVIVDDPPERGYCKRNKPIVSELFAFAELQKESAGGFEDLEKVFAKPDMTGVLVTKELPRKNNSGKLDWNVLLDTIVGSPKSEEIIVNVGVGVPRIGRIVFPRKKPTKIDEKFSVVEENHFVPTGKFLFPTPKPNL